MEVENCTFGIKGLHKMFIILMRNYFPKRSSMHCFKFCQNFMMLSLVLYTPCHLRQCIALFAVAEGWLLLDIGWFVLFLKERNCIYSLYNLFSKKGNKTKCSKKRAYKNQCCSGRAYRNQCRPADVTCCDVSNATAPVTPSRLKTTLPKTYSSDFLRFATLPCWHRQKYKYIQNPIRTEFIRPVFFFFSWSKLLILRFKKNTKYEMLDIQNKCPRPSASHFVLKSNISYVTLNPSQ